MKMIELNKIYNEDCLEGMKRIPDGSVHCVITSPPYNVDLGNNKYNKFGYGQHEDNLPHEKYLRWMRSVFQECYRVLSSDGRICVNIGDGRNGKVPTHSDFIFLLREVVFKPITTINCNKNNTSNRCAWGSYLSAKAPSFPRSFEYILIFGKTDSLQRDGETTVTKLEWREYTNGLWTFAPERNQKRIGHPAMFPLELPSRLIKMLTYNGDIVLDPFMGSGTTAIAAIRTKRNFIGFELQKEYFDMAEKRIKDERRQLTLF